MAYTDPFLPHAGSAELLFNGMFDEFAGTIARTIPRRLVTVNSLAAFTVGGQVAVTSVPLPQGMVISNLAFLSGGTAANGPTHWWLALLDVQLNVLAVTADQLTAAIGANTFLKVPVSIPVALSQSGLYYFAASVTASTTAPTASGSAPTTGAAAGAPVLCGTAGSQSAPPAVGAQLAAGVVTNNTTCSIGGWLS
jgi:hypothetical protein